MIKYFKKNLSILIVISLAAFLRLYKITSYMEFLGDQGRDVYIVRKFLTNFDLMFIGPQTSIGNMYLGPFYYYLMAPFLLLFNFNPVGPAIMVVLFSLLTTFFIYHVYIKLFENKNFALLSSLLYAISPVAIKYSNFSWNPNIMPFFSLSFFYLSYLILFKNKFHLLPLLTISFIFALNSHYLALILLPIFAFFSFIYFLKNKPLDKKFLNKLLKPLIISVIILFLSFLPLILFDIKHHGQNIKALIQFFTVRQTTVNLKVYKAIPLIYPLFEQINTRLIFAKILFWGQIGTILLLVSIIISLLTKTVYKFKYLLIFSFVSISLLCLGLYKQHIYDHYFGFLFPILFIFFTSTLQIISKYKILLPLVIFMIIIPIYLSLKYNTFASPPLNQVETTKKITSLISKEANSRPFNLALIAKNNYDPPYRYFLELDNQPLYTLKQKKTDQLFVICQPNPDINCFPEGNPLWDIAAFGVAKVENNWQINGINIYKMVSY